MVKRSHTNKPSHIKIPSNKHNSYNIHDPSSGNDHHKAVAKQISKNHLDGLNRAHDNKNIISENILDKSLNTIIKEFPTKMNHLIDDISNDIVDLNNEDPTDALDWIVKLINILYKIFIRLTHKDNCLMVGILLIIISIFIHYFNITQVN